MVALISGKMSAPQGPSAGRSAAALADAVRAGRRAARDAVEEALDRITAVDPLVGAFVLIDPETARAMADEVDRVVAAGHDPGPLAGVPIAVKDVEDVAGWPTRFGSCASPARLATADSAEIGRLRRAGAVFVGKTTAGEFGTGFTTKTRLHDDTALPVRVAHSAGGSSGGSAAAVASGAVFMATGTDGGGSVRVPAAFCGTVGFKPSHGIVAGSPRDRAGLVEPGVLTMVPSDARRWLDVVSTVDVGSGPAVPLRIAYVPQLGGAPVERDIAAAVDHAARAAATVDAAGVAELTDIDIQHLGLTEWAILSGIELREDLVANGVWPDRADELGPELRWFLEELDTIALIDVISARAMRGVLEARMRQVFRAVDVLVTPATAVVAPPRGGPFLPVIAGRDGSTAGPAPFSPIANLCGSPAVVIPVGHTTDGLPIGMQLMGAPQSDRSLLALADRLLSQISKGAAR